MTHPPSKEKLARFGRWSVEKPVARGLVDEARRCGIQVEALGSQIITWWYEDVYLPHQRLREKQAIKKPPG